MFNFIRSISLLLVAIGLVVVAADSTEDVKLGKHSRPLRSVAKFAEKIAAQNTLVFFYGSGCSLSQEFAPKYEKLAAQFADNANIAFAHVDCEHNAAICEAQKGQAYEIYLYPLHEQRVRFLAVRDADGIARFLIKHLGDDVLDGTELDVPRSTASIIELTADTFKEHVAVGEHFVKFYAPWCGHCQRLAPTWDELATAVEPDQSVSIAKIDCTQHRPICVDYEVKGYPSLLWIVDGKRIHKYTGSRTIEELKAYVEATSTVVVDRRAAAAAEAAAAAAASSDDAEGVITSTTHQKDQGTVHVETGVLVLNSRNFAHILEHGVTFVKFYAPWCGHCKRMAPRWEELASKFVGVASVKIAKVDCTEQFNKEVCSEQDVNGFPTIFIYRDGAKLEEYNGNRSLEDLVEFVKRFSTRDEL